MAKRDGVSVQQALEILAERSALNEQSSENQCPCSRLEGGNFIPRGAQNMGQTIDLLDAGVSPESAAAVVDHQKLDEERAKRKEQLESKLDSMSTKELLQTVLDVQEQRVATYRAFDR